MRVPGVRTPRAKVPGIALALASFLLLPAAAATPALGHGGAQQRALAEAPARSLTQQALGLVTQRNDMAEAAERLEAALESKDRRDVDLAAVRGALNAIGKGDRELAVDRMNAALAPGGGEAAGGMEGMQGGAQPAAGALEHPRGVEPKRGTAEWLAFAVGIAAAIVAVALLLRGRAPAH